MYKINIIFKETKYSGLLFSRLNIDSAAESKAVVTKERTVAIGVGTTLRKRLAKVVWRF